MQDACAQMLDRVDLRDVEAATQEAEDGARLREGLAGEADESREERWKEEFAETEMQNLQAYLKAGISLA